LIKRSAKLEKQIRASSVDQSKRQTHLAMSRPKQQVEQKVDHKRSYKIIHDRLKRDLDEQAKGKEISTREDLEDTLKALGYIKG